MNQIYCAKILFLCFSIFSGPLVQLARLVMKNLYKFTFSLLFAIFHCSISNNNSRMREKEKLYIRKHVSSAYNKYIPLATGDTIKIFAKAAPCPCPIIVTMFGLPLNAGRFSLSQCKPATRSISPKFPWALPFVPVFKNPDYSEAK